MKPNGEVHPAAAVFPMLADDDLAELAADIKANGQREPVVLLPDGTLLDGRNRLAACQQAGVEPTFTVYDGDDPAGYVLSLNVHRRHMTKGARAMAVALVVRDEPRTVRAAAADAGVAHAGVVKASTVLEYAPELADVVLAGGSLDDAYATARKRKADATSAVAVLERLRHEAPDLAEQVDAERLTVGEADAAHRERQRRRADEQRDAVALLERIVGLAAPPSPDPAYVSTWADRIGDASVDLGRLRLAVSTLSDLADRITHDVR